MSARTVILTHEHTDFDALASLLGAALLFPQALPILPRKLNRNVQAFLALYKNQFPFIEPRHLLRGPVDLAILVDTRRVNPVKGMDHTTHYLLIDHHSSAEPLPKNWQMWRDSLGPHTTGANATLLVEQLMQQNARLPSLQATLLALGIYEDTGSLLYASTTPRDMRCAAWLLEQGAHLEMIRRFTQYPLSIAQQQLTQQLTEHAQHLTVAGHHIVLALAHAPDFEDELSVLAHKVQERFDPDGVFLVVNLGDRVQVVARSTTDALHVGTITTALGGGGHSRAAAALLRATTVEIVRDQIIALAHKHVHPPATVAQIMSWGQPHTLDKEMSVAAAMELMQRYGHEGFPVLQKTDDGTDQLVGILTRREADRTLSHRLGSLPVHKVMRKGTYTIRPHASIKELHLLMIESGWGQIPVVDQADILTGIVTRTDLLKFWGENRQGSAQPPNVRRELEQSLTETQQWLLRMAGEYAAALGQALYVVGGFARDLLLGRINAAGPSGLVDVDFVVEGDAIRLVKQLQDQCGGRVVTHDRFGTAKWILDEPNQPLCLPSSTDAGQLPPHLDFVTARTEFYQEPTILPTVEQGNIKLDLHRRDFTMNTLAIALTPDHWGDLLDFYAGLSDLRTGLVRVLHSLSFVDDPTRILRAVRYEQRFDFHLEARTEEHLRDAVPLLGRVTGARIRHELERIFQEAEPEKAILRLEELGVLAQIQPGLRAGPAFARHSAALRAQIAGSALTNGLDEPLERLYWGLLIYDLLPTSERPSMPIEKALTARLKLRGETQKLMAQLQKVKARLAQLTAPYTRPSTIVSALDRMQPSTLLLLSLLEENELLQERLHDYLQTWQHVHPSLDGNDLRHMGLGPGPLYGKILHSLRVALLDGEIEAGPEEQLLAQAIIHDELQARETKERTS